MGLYVATVHGFKSIKTTFSSDSSFFGRDTESTQKSYPLTPNGSISIATANGDITITSHKNPEVLLTIIKQGNKNDFPFIEAQTTSESSNFSVKTIYKKNNCHASISYELIVPASATITTETTNGSITTNNVKGIVKAKSTNGSLTFENVAGLSFAKTTNGRIKVQADTLASQSDPIILKTTNGSISFEAKNIEPNSFSLSTTNGSISVTVPGNLEQYRSSKTSASFSVDGKASFEIDTQNGSISVNNPSK